MNPSSDKINAAVSEKERAGAKGGGNAASEQSAADEGDELRRRDRRGDGRPGRPPFDAPAPLEARLLARGAHC